MGKAIARILIVDDDWLIRLELEQILTDMGHNVIGKAESARQCFEMARDLMPDLILMDIVMPGGMDGIEAAEKVHKHLDIPIIFISGYSDPKYVERAKQVNPFGYILKPFDEREIKTTIEIAIHNRAMELKLRQAHEALKNANQKLEQEIKERKENLERFLLLMDSLDASVYAVDIQTHEVVFMNQYMKNLFGDCLGKVCWKSIHSGQSGPCEFCNRDLLIETSGNPGKPIVWDHYSSRTKRWFEIRDQALIWPDGRTVLVKIAYDITIRKEAEEALRQSEEKYREFVEGTDDLIAQLDKNGHFIYANPAMKRALGKTLDQLTGMSIFRFLDPEDVKNIQASVSKCTRDREPGIAFESRLGKDENGERCYINWMLNFHYDDRGEVVICDMIGRNLTEQKKLKDATFKLMQLEALGVLAGGIAHDFNNLMASVLGNIGVAKMEMSPESAAFLKLCKAEMACLQTKKLTSQLITFSEGGGPITKTVIIGTFLKDFVSTSLKCDDIDYRFSIHNDILPVKVDAEQIKQVVWNIVANAQEAMDGKGTILVSCENVENLGNNPNTFNEAKYVKISIKDHGRGIPEKNLKKIFDPYFSTKKMCSRKGVGLGLSISDSIVKKHNGFITVDSQLGQGTTLSVCLPAIRVERKGLNDPVKRSSFSPRLNIIETPSKTDDPASTIHTVLVMDDEEQLREICHSILTRFGYEVDVAIDGVEAIEKYQQAKESARPFDTVILDLTNKVGMGGMETIQKLLKIDPAVKAILSTGHSKNPVLNNFRGCGFRACLIKPFTFDELKAAFRDVMTDG